MNDFRGERLSAGRFTLGRSLRAARTRSRRTLAELATATGLSQSYLSDVKRGRRLPTLDALDVCAAALDTCARDLLRGQYPWDAVPAPADPGPPADGRALWRKTSGHTETLGQSTPPA